MNKRRRFKAKGKRRQRRRNSQLKQLPKLRIAWERMGLHWNQSITQFDLEQMREKYREMDRALDYCEYGS